MSAWKHYFANIYLDFAEQLHMKQREALCKVNQNPLAAQSPCVQFQCEERLVYTVSAQWKYVSRDVKVWKQ